MLLSSTFVAIVAPLYAILQCTLVTASPVEDKIKVQLDKRQEPNDPSNVAAEDETDAEIAADGTGPLRKGKSQEEIAQSLTDAIKSYLRSIALHKSALGNLVSDRRPN